MIKSFPMNVSSKTLNYGGCPRGVMVKAMDCGIVVREFVLQSRYYVHFRANTIGKGKNPLILPAMGSIAPLRFWGCPHGVMIKAMDCGIVWIK